MKIILSLLLAAVLSISHAGTVYKDRNIYLPGQVCMVEFNGQSINANLIREVYAGPLYTERGEWEGFIPRMKWYRRDFFGLKVTMATNHTYTNETATAAEAEVRKFVFLKLISDTCK